MKPCEQYKNIKFIYENIVILPGEIEQCETMAELNNLIDKTALVQASFLKRRVCEYLGLSPNSLETNDDK